MNTLKISNELFTIVVTNIDKSTDGNTGISFCTGTAKITVTGKPEDGILYSAQVTGMSAKSIGGWRDSTKDMITQVYSLLETYTMENHNLYETATLD